MTFVVLLADFGGPGFAMEFNTYDICGLPFKRVVNNMRSTAGNVLSIKFHNKSWAAFGCQMIFR